MNYVIIQNIVHTIKFIVLQWDLNIGEMGWIKKCNNSIDAECITKAK